MTATVIACGSTDNDLTVSLQLPWKSIPPFPEECHGAVIGLPDEIALANELLTAQTEDLIFDARERDSLAKEIGGVLESIHAIEPRAAHVTVLPDYNLRTVNIKLSSDSSDILNSTLGEGELFGPMLTGIPEIDALNSRLGLKGIWVLRSQRSPGLAVSLCLADRINIPVAAEEYAELDDVEWAEVSGRLGDGSDIAIAKMESDWYVVVDRAGGDCPSGCTEHELFYFKVSSGVPEPYRERDALRLAVFRQLREDTLWR